MKDKKVLKKDKRRYYLHHKIKVKEPDDYLLLNPNKRDFSSSPSGKFSNKLLKEFQYNIQLKII